MRVVHRTEVIVDLQRAVEVIGPAGVDAFRAQIARHENFDGSKMPENSEKTKKRKNHDGILVDTGGLLLALDVQTYYSDYSWVAKRNRAVVRIGWTSRYRKRLRGLWGLGYELVGGLSNRSMKPLRDLIWREGIFTEQKLK
jgi:hypothetical protein